ncbi:MAG TPA: pseudouridine synthase [Polyangia bacterium]|nr:pseudouridine synthase [Polyangia bacterium]
MRLDVLLARNAGWSRTAARAVIAEGRVRIAGETAEDPRRDVGEDALPFTVTVDDADLPLYDRVSLMLNKPTGCVTALRDPQHPTAYALLRAAPLHGELRPVGRLDLDTSGLLLWTNDGAEIQRLTHPKRAVPRTYQAALARSFAPLPPKLVLDDGHEPNVTALAPLDRAAAHPSLQVPPETAALAAITIIGGAYHEVRRIFAALDSHVLGLCRVRFGDRELPRELAPGAFLLLPSEAAR